MRRKSDRDQAWARRYIWGCLAATLEADLKNGSAYIFEDDDHNEFDRRRILEAVDQVLVTLRMRASKGTLR